MIDQRPAYQTSTDQTSSFEKQDDLAAQRGVPSLVWRAGQDRRLNMILNWSGRSSGESLGHVLIAGCGVGMYVNALLPYSAMVCGFDVEAEHIRAAHEELPTAYLQLAACEYAPFANDSFDLVLSHEVLEHVADDRMSTAEIARVLKPGGRAIIFVPNRFAPFETHGHYWRGKYYFGNTPLINYLPNFLRDKLAPHVRAYTPSGLRSLFIGEPVRILHHSQVFPGWDKVVHRRPVLGKTLKTITYMMEKSPLAILGLSHLLVVEKVAE